MDDIDKIKRLTIIAMVSDDYLMEQLVLKGGNAIDIVYQFSGTDGYKIKDIIDWLGFDLGLAED